MAMVTLHGRGEAVTARLPRVCARCGAPATLFKETKFVWWPAWLHVLVLTLVPSILILVLRRFMRVRLPLCERHRYPWFWQTYLRVMALLYVLVLPWFVIFITAGAAGRGHRVAAVLLLGWFVGLFAMMGAVIFVARRSIRPVEITRDSITLTGVSEEFANAVR